MNANETKADGHKLIPALLLSACTLLAALSACADNDSTHSPRAIAF